jgi:hypothetical protein
VAVSILARTVASGGHGSDTELFPCPAEDDHQENGLGHFWTLAGKGERECWARNGPKQGKYIFFFQKYFLFSVSKDPLLFYKIFCRFKIVYENLKLFSLLHNK